MPARTSGPAVAACAALGLSPAWAQAPLSAIDWLTEAATAPVPARAEAPRAAPAAGAAAEPIEVAPLLAPAADSVGLVPAAASGLPADLWGSAPAAQLAGLLDRISPNDLLPATRELLFRLLLAELDPPASGDADGAFLAARVRTLTRLGAVEPAHALLERAGPATAEQFALLFDLSVLLGVETKACRELAARPGLGAAAATRIFCLARTGDWAAAAVVLDAAAALGRVEAGEAALLARFLDPGLDEGAAPLDPPAGLDPLTFRLFEAVGEPLPTIALPVAYAHADLRPTAGWKAQVEAAERLARAGALPAGRLLGLYARRRPAGSGGVWERVRAVQRLDGALASGDADALSRALPAAWSAMAAAGLEPVLADLYRGRFLDFPVTGEARDVAFRLALLGGDHAAASRLREPAAASHRFLAALAAGDPAAAPAPDGLAAAVAEAFARDGGGARPARGAGASLLRSIDLIGAGMEGDLGKITAALALLRGTGLESAARRAAVELLVLERRG